MSAFSRPTFDAVRYLSYRPSYPRWLYNEVFGFHAKSTAAKWERAIDLGCGPGIVTVPLSTRFSHVIGVEPSRSMINNVVKPGMVNAKAIEGFQEEEFKGGVDYRQGTAEDLPWLETDSVDLVTAGQAAHWFDYPKIWKELTRVVRPGGTVAFFGYGEFFLPRHPSLDPLIVSYATSTPCLPVGHGPSTLGDYWQQPGRSIVEGLLDAVPFPTDADAELDSGKASKWDGDSSQRIKWLGRGERERRLSKVMTWDQLDGYLHTFSALHAYLDTHPAQKGTKDIATMFMEELRCRAQAEGADDKVEVAWPLVLVLIRKRP